MKTHLSEIRKRNADSLAQVFFVLILFFPVHLVKAQSNKQDSLALEKNNAKYEQFYDSLEYNPSLTVDFLKWLVVRNINNLP